MIYSALSVNITFICTSFRSSNKCKLMWESLASFAGLFRSGCKYIVYLHTMYVYCAYRAMSKSPKQLPYCLKGTEASVVLLIWNGVFWDVRTYIITRKVISWSVTVYNKHVSSQFNLNMTISNRTRITISI